MTLEFWFEFGSTYSYPTAMRIEEEAARAGVALVWKAFLLGPIFKAQGWNDSPFNLYPPKGRYMWRDLERVCAAQRVPFRRPSLFPRNGLLAARVAAAHPDVPWLPRFVRAVYTANFAEDRDIADAEVVARCIADAGADPALVLQHAQSDTAKASLRAVTEDAAARGIFGAPSFVATTELFWGNDRLHDALLWAQRQARPDLGIRAARADEAGALSDLAFRSKAHWGYSAEFMERSRAELSISPAAISRQPVFVAEAGGVVVGFYSLETLSSEAVELNHLFVDPAHIGQRAGAALLDHAIARARERGARVMVVQSDPHAEGFYRARGAVRVGERPSGSIPGRRLPLLEVALTDSA